MPTRWQLNATGGTLPFLPCKKNATVSNTMLFPGSHS